MNQLEKRPIQTKIKHLILSEYLRSWGYIITMGLTSTYKRNISEKSLITRFVYVDCFSYSGVYEPENGEAVFGSPIIGIESLDKLSENFLQYNGVRPWTNVILVEEKRDNYHTLLDTLRKCGYGNRIKGADDMGSLHSGDIVVINDDYRQHIDAIMNVTSQKYTWSFYLLDPFGPRGISLDVVSRIMSQPHVDTIINLMYHDLHKKTGSAAKDKPDPRHLSHLEYYDALYGDSNWKGIAQKYYNDIIGKDEMERELVDLYKSALARQDKDVAVKRIPLKFEDKERTMFYLFLTTHDGTGALKMNEILDSAKITEYDHREKAKHTKTQQMSMFEVVPDPHRPSKSIHDVDEIANSIYQLCRHESITFRDVLLRLADTPYYFDQVKKAMTKLKRSERCSYSELSNREIITFY